MSTPKPPSFPWDSVPEELRAPSGPIHKAPDEYGGEGWRVTPFTGPEPWKQWAEKHGGGIKPGPALPDDFERVFGPRPKQKTSADYFAVRLARASWDQELQSFIRVGTPEGITGEQIAAADLVYNDWGMGPIEFVEMRHGWRAVWPGQQQIVGFDANPQSAVLSPHNHVALWQIRTVQGGGEVAGEKRHPWVPPGVWPE